MDTMDTMDTIEALQQEIKDLEEELQESSLGLLALTLELQQAEEKYRLIIERSTDGIIQTDKNGMLTYTNPAAAIIFGCTNSEEMVNKFKSLSNLFDVSAQSIINHRNLMKGKPLHSTVMGNKLKRKETFWLDCNIQPIFDENKNIIGLDSVLRDTTKEKENYEKMQLASKVIQHSLEGIIITDKEKRILVVNPAFTKMTGYTQDEVFMKNPSILGSGWHDTTFYKEMWKSIDKTGYWFGEISDRKKDGSLYAQETTICAIKNDDNEITNYCAISSDVTERKKMAEKVKNLAYFDYLTKLPNRYLFKERLSLAIENVDKDNSGIVLFFLDLDNFKIINDTLGHYYGDKLLQEVALRLNECVRNDDTVARLGGDEFTVFFEIDEKEIVMEVANKIAERLNEPYNIEGKVVYSSPSIGIAFYPDDALTYTDLLKCADTAMYLSKEKGKNQINFFKNSLNIKIQKYHLIETQLRTAVKNGEFTLYYQPVIDLKSAKIQGAEALLRWNNPILGSVSPDVFIPHAEQSGLILEIGNWVIEEACRNLQYFYELGYTELCISINVSANQLREENFIHTVLSNLERYKIATKNFAIEVTETSMIEYIDEVLPKLQTLKEYGVTVLLDDFGTGYSSMSYLKKLPSNIIKIDRTFIKDLPDDIDDMQIMVAIIAMSHALNKIVTAEGVETQEQLALLLKYHCNKIQGYYFYKPMQLDMFMESLKDQTSIQCKINEALKSLKG